MPPCQPTRCAECDAHAQGTLYPDVIESCPPPGSGRKHSHTIKSHHNVGGLPKDLKFQLVEPLRELFKVSCHPVQALWSACKLHFCRNCCTLDTWCSGRLVHG